MEHVHVQLQLFNRGRPVPVPAQIGIPQTGACLYWLHTHSNDGFIHIESPVRRTFTLGQFFDIWGPDLSWNRAGAVAASRGTRLRVWVNGVPWHGNDPRDIVLRDRETVVIQNGPPFAKPARRGLVEILSLDGHHLSLEAIEAVADGAPVEIAAEARARVERAREFVDRNFAEGKTIYGVTTGFGRSGERFDRARRCRATATQPRAQPCRRHRAHRSTGASSAPPQCCALMR